MFKSSEDSVVESSLLCYISSGDYMKKLMFDCDDTLYDLSWPFPQMHGRISSKCRCGYESILCGLS